MNGNMMHFSRVCFRFVHLVLRMANNYYELRKNSTDHLTLEIEFWGRNLPSIFFPRPRNIVLGHERSFTCL